MANTAVKLYLCMVVNENSYSEEEIQAYIDKQSDDDRIVIEMINQLCRRCVEEELQVADENVNAHLEAIEEVQKIVYKYIEDIGGSNTEFNTFVANKNTLLQPRKHYVPVEGQKIQIPITGGYIIKQAYVEE